MLILPPYSRREDEQLQSILKFSGPGTFSKVPEKKIKTHILATKTSDKSTPALSILSWRVIVGIC